MGHWSDKYIGIPFRAGGRDAAGCDCAGLVLLVLREERGIIAQDTAFDYDGHDFHGKAGQARLAGLLHDCLREWLVVTGQPRPFDMVRYRVGGNPCHVGVCIGGGMFLHVEKRHNAHCLALSAPSWKDRIVEFRRHVQLGGAA